MQSEWIRRHSLFGSSVSSGSLHATTGEKRGAVDQSKIRSESLTKAEMDRISEASRNNAHLYTRVCGAHGCRTELTDSFLICLDTPPRFYGRAVTLTPSAYAGLEPRLTGGFKDSFFDSNPDPKRYEVLFEAHWIWREPRSGARPTLDWRSAGTDQELLEWEEGWAKGDDEAGQHPRQFPPSLLAHDDLSFMGAYREGSLVGGALLNLSDPVVGISNAYTLDLSEDELWGELAALASARLPHMPVTGYERGESLESAIRAGFDSIAPLRVWTERT
jgi:hypothetical protein